MQHTALTTTKENRVGSSPLVHTISPHTNMIFPLFYYITLLWICQALFFIFLIFPNCAVRL